MTKLNLIENPYALKDIKGLGPKRLAILNEMNIHTIQDLVLYLPARYEDNTLVDLTTAEDESHVTVRGKYIQPPLSLFLEEIVQN